MITTTSTSTSELLCTDRSVGWLAGLTSNFTWKKSGNCRDFDDDKNDNQKFTGTNHFFVLSCSFLLASPRERNKERIECE